MRNKIDKYTRKIVILLIVIMMLLFGTAFKNYRPDIVFYATGKANKVYQEGMQVTCTIVDRHKGRVQLVCTYAE